MTTDVPDDIAASGVRRLLADDDAAVAPLVRKLDLCCGLCGYGIVSRLPPMRCPMCGGDAVWAEPPSWGSRRAALHERRAS